MADDVALPAERKARGPRGNYAVSAGIKRALTLLASGAAKTQGEACATAGVTTRALQLAMKRPSTKTWLQSEIMSALGISALKAAKRMDELLHSSNEMVGFQASRFALATGAGVAPPERSGATVSVNIGVAAGYILDLTEPGGPVIE